MGEVPLQNMSRGKLVILVLLLVVLILLFKRDSMSLTKEVKVVTTVVETEERQVLCQAKHDPTKPTFFFILGSEGTGHHLFAGVIGKISNVVLVNLTLQKKFYSIFEPTVPESIKKEMVNELLKGLKEYNDPSKIYIIQAESFGMFSYPYDNPRTTLRRPDVLEMIPMLETLYNLKFLVTLRNERDAIVSLIRRNWWSKNMCVKHIPTTQYVSSFGGHEIKECGYINVQGRIMEDSNAYINAQVQSISSTYYRVARYEEIIESPLKFVQPLASFLNVDPVELEEIFKTSIRKPKSDYKSTLTDIEMEANANLFNKYHYLQWNHILNPKLNLLRYNPETPNPLENEEKCF